MTLVQDSVLVVTTDPLLGGHAVKLLEASGCQVRVVGMVSAAVQEVRRKTPALVIVDRRLLVEEVLQRHHFPTGVAVIAINPSSSLAAKMTVLPILRQVSTWSFARPVLANWLRTSAPFCAGNRWRLLRRHCCR